MAKQSRATALVEYHIRRNEVGRDVARQDLAGQTPLRQFPAAVELPSRPSRRRDSDLCPRLLPSNSPRPVVGKQRGVPDLDDPPVIGGGQAVAVRAEGETGDSRLIAAEGKRLPAGGQVPDVDCPRQVGKVGDATGSGQPPAVGAEGRTARVVTRSVGEQRDRSCAGRCRSPRPGTVPSPLAEARSPPSWLNASRSMSVVCPVRVRAEAPLERSQKLHLVSSLLAPPSSHLQTVVASPRPSGLKANPSILRAGSVRLRTS